MPEDRPLIGFEGRWSLTTRILAVNIFVIAILAGSFFYLDSYRARVSEERTRQEARDVALIARALAAVPAAERPRLAAGMARVGGERVRLYGANGVPRIDSWAEASPTYRLIDPASEPWQLHAARLIDRLFDGIVGAHPAPPFVEPAPDRLQAWPEAVRAARYPGLIVAYHRLAPDRTPVISAAVAVPGLGTLLAINNVRDITRIVRAERFAVALVVCGSLLIAVLLSLFLARTIARPLRRLAIAAHRVRLGRAREVVVPRLPSRRDEIGLLARALSDMSQALRARIDAVEAFAADVSHELKNPLASLRSAVEGLDSVEAPELRRQLTAIVRDDVMRLDRLITEIAEASRLDAELSRARFDPVDLGLLVEQLLAAREARGLNRGVRIAYARPAAASTLVMGDGSRLARLVEKLIDNAVSFSPPGGLVEVGASAVAGQVRLTVRDEGPGVPEERREAIFRRFHTDRREPGDGRHSGLGLAIARAIAEGHGGSISVHDRDDGLSGAHFLVTLPAVPAP